jgi:hypothetical protein
VPLLVGCRSAVAAPFAVVGPATIPERVHLKLYVESSYFRRPEPDRVSAMLEVLEVLEVAVECLFEARG